MANKVLVSREVAEAIERVKRIHDFDSALSIHLNGDYKKSFENKILDALTTEQFAKAWLLGCEVELTPEEIIRKQYLSPYNPPEGYYDTFSSGIRFVIDTLGITIEGINGKERF